MERKRERERDFSPLVYNNVCKIEHVERIGEAVHRKNNNRVVKADATMRAPTRKWREDKYRTPRFDDIIPFIPSFSPIFVSNANGLESVLFIEL